MCKHKPFQYDLSGSFSAENKNSLSSGDSLLRCTGLAMLPDLQPAAASTCMAAFPRAMATMIQGRPCISIRGSVGPLVHPSVGP